MRFVTDSQRRAVFAKIGRPMMTTPMFPYYMGDDEQPVPMKVTLSDEEVGNVLKSIADDHSLSYNVHLIDNGILPKEFAEKYKVFARLEQ